MKSKKLVSAILAAASIAGGVVGAQAATIDDLAAKVQEQLDAQDYKTKHKMNPSKHTAQQSTLTKMQSKLTLMQSKLTKQKLMQKIHILKAVSKTIPLTSIKTKLLSKTKQKIVKMQTRSCRTTSIRKQQLALQAMIC